MLNEQGLITVTGGKLTTFRAIALDTLRHAARAHATLKLNWQDERILSTPTVGPDLLKLDATEQARLIGRYGDRANALLASAMPSECQPIAGTRIWWAELRWIAQHEAVHHLDDLLLRRTRLGLVLCPTAAKPCSRKFALSCKLHWAGMMPDGEQERLRYGA